MIFGAIDAVLRMAVVSFQNVVHPGNSECVRAGKNGTAIIVNHRSNDPLILKVIVQTNYPSWGKMGNFG